MHTIISKQLPAASYLAQRIKITAYSGSDYFEWDETLDAEKNHIFAAMKFARDRGWLDQVHLLHGMLPDESGYAFILIHKE